MNKKALFLAVTSIFILAAFNLTACQKSDDKKANVLRTRGQNGQVLQKPGRVQPTPGANTSTPGADGSTPVVVAQPEDITAPKENNGCHVDKAENADTYCDYIRVRVSEGGAVQLGAGNYKPNQFTTTDDKRSADKKIVYTYLNKDFRTLESSILVVLTTETDSQIANQFEINGLAKWELTASARDELANDEVTALLKDKNNIIVIQDKSVAEIRWVELEQTLRQNANNAQISRLAVNSKNEAEVFVDNQIEALNITNAALTFILPTQLTGAEKASLEVRVDGELVSDIRTNDLPNPKRTKITLLNLNAFKKVDYKVEISYTSAN